MPRKSGSKSHGNSHFGSVKHASNHRGGVGKNMGRKSKRG